MKRKIRKIGNCLMVAISPIMLETIGLKVGDTTDVKIKNGKIEISKIDKGDKK